MFKHRLSSAPLAVTLGLLLAASPAVAFDAPPSSSTPPSASSSGGQNDAPIPVPEPAAIGLFALGIAGAYLIRRRDRKGKE